MAPFLFCFFKTFYFTQCLSYCTEYKFKCRSVITFSYRSYPSAYIKNTYNKWWDHFNPTDIDHRVVILDDVHPSWKDIHYLKQWADR